MVQKDLSLMSRRMMKWVMYFEKSNPFINAVELPGMALEVESSGNYKIIIDLTNPINITLSTGD